jgi:hypothetical protein
MNFIGDRRGKIKNRKAEPASLLTAVRPLRLPAIYLLCGNFLAL